MSKEEKSTVIQIFVPDLPDTPGWLKLSRKKQDTLLEITSENQQFRQLKGLGEFGELMTVYKAQELLEGEEMKLSDYLRRIYPERHQRTLDRKREKFAELIAGIHPSLIKKIATLGTQHLEHLDRLANAALGDIRNAMKEVPSLALPAGTDEDVLRRLDELDSKLLEHRKAKHKGKALHMNENAAAKMATNAVVSYIRACGLKTSGEKRVWIRRVVGWVMEAQAITGSVSTERVPIPDGILIKRGRPPKRKKEAA